MYSATSDVPEKEKSLGSILDPAIFDNKSVLVDESLGQNCDFLLMELCKIYKYSIFQFNDSGTHMKALIARCGVTATVKSIYDSTYDNEEMIDDVYTQKQLGYHQMAKIYIYRSGTASVKDYYKYDLIVKIDNLMSGCSNEIDGTIRIFQRDTVYCNIKYKILLDKIVYYS